MSNQWTQPGIQPQIGTLSSEACAVYLKIRRQGILNMCNDVKDCMFKGKLFQSEEALKIFDGSKS